jgi:hypothetical protein
MAYLDRDAFRDLTIASTAIVDRVEAMYPGWIARQLAFHSDRIDSRLRKRYAVPFAAPPLTPPTIALWLCAIVTPVVMLKQGMAAEDELLVSAQRAAADAEAQLTEAANAEAGLFDLPMRSDSAASGISQGAPLAYTETSPYAWITERRTHGVGEDWP